MIASLYFAVGATALAASALTFFSGFGLGTLLMPVMALFFPLPTAIALTGIVHFLNGLFKLALVGRQASRKHVVRFGIPATAAAFAGAYLLTYLAVTPALTSYDFFGRTLHIRLEKVGIAAVMLLFTAYELVPRLRDKNFDEKYLGIGGLISGFFGGLSGHQGALRSAFLAKAGLSKESFIGTGVVIACLIDVARIGTYAVSLDRALLFDNVRLVAFATLVAFTGSYLGNRYLKKVTMDFVQTLVGVALVLLSLAIGMGLA